MVNGLVVIAVSGLPGAGTSTISRHLADKLGIEYFSPGEFFKGESNLEKENESAIDVWLNQGKEKKFHEDLDNLQIEKAKKGNIVICGKLSIHVLDGIADIGVWVDCSFDKRVERVSERDDISLGNARKKLLEREEIESKEWKRIYGIDRLDQREKAVIVVDSGEMELVELVAYIVELLD